MSDTLFRQVNYPLDHLINSIELGQIGLPDIQRPFVWKNSKVRDLFDSMYRGYPVGYLLFWENAFEPGSNRVIGTDTKQKVPSLLIVDGQQRLTSLYAVLQGIPVVRQNYESEAIEIAFNPLLERFEVADAAIKRDKTYIPNVSSLWKDGQTLYRLITDYRQRLEDSRPVSPEEGARIEQAIDRLHSLRAYPFTALELSRDIDEEQVAEIFVRVNSEGIRLNQADFILTLMSVFWDEGRAALEDFCREARSPTTGEGSAFNHYIQPDPAQLLRVAVGLGFRRARLQFVYSILRGKDLDTGEVSEERRDAQFAVLKDAQARTLRLTHWHDYFKALRRAGYVGGRMITSNNNLLFTYVLYLVGRTDYNVPERELRRVIAKWFFMASLTGRYTGSAESTLESDLARFREVDDPEEFVRILDRVCDDQLTNDFWNITLPNELATSSPYSPSLFAYRAALVLLDARPLFSDQKIESLLEPSVHSSRKAAERHHLFPKAYLKSLGMTSTRVTNQIANYAILEWGDNSEISDSPPAEYMPLMRERVSQQALGEMYYWHALPNEWEHMEYPVFLERRRELIAQVIKDAYQKLAGEQESDDSPRSLDELLLEGEGTYTEFKSTLRMNMHTGKKDDRLEHSCLKTIAGFLNRDGGTLVVGVSDDGSPVGIETDGFASEDRMNLHLTNLVKSQLGPEAMMYIHPHFQELDGTRVFMVECSPSQGPIYLRKGNDEQFFVRTGASTTELLPSQIQEYIMRRFR